MDPAVLARFEMTKDDILAFHLYHQQHSPTARKDMRWVMALPIAVGILCGAVSFAKPGLHRLQISAVGLIALGLLLPFISRRSSKRVLSRMLEEGAKKRAPGSVEIALTPAEIRMKGPQRSETISWAGVDRIVGTGSALYLYTSGISAIIIPRRAFGQESEYEAFAAAARTYLAEASAGTKGS